MEVKMFVCNNPLAAEKEITEWLAQNQIAITHITQSQSERGGTFVFVVSVFYTRMATATQLVSETKANLSFA